MQHHKYFSSGRLTAAGPALDLADVGREDEGVYVCVADNQVSRPVTESIALNVLCESSNTTMEFYMIFCAWVHLLSCNLIINGKRIFFLME